MYRWFVSLSVLLLNLLMIGGWCWTALHCNATEASQLVAHRKYTVLIDSGSTGSRVYVYSYERDQPLTTLVEVAHQRARPALSTFYNDFPALRKQLKGLIRFAEDYVPVSEQSETQIALQATAGLRSLPAEQQQWIIDRARQLLSTSKFLVDPDATRVLTGEEEALFGLIATNAAFGELSSSSSNRSGASLDVAGADLGGSSQQLAFMLPRISPSLSEISLLDRISKIFATVWSAVSLPSTYVNQQLSAHQDMLQVDTSTTIRGFQIPEQCRADFRISLNEEGQFVDVLARSMPGLGLVEAFHDTLVDLVEAQSQSAMTLAEEQTVDCLSESILSEAEAGDEPSACLSKFSVTGNATAQTIINPCVSPGARYPYPAELDSFNWIQTGDFKSCTTITQNKLRLVAHREIQCIHYLRSVQRSQHVPNAIPVIPTIIAMDNFPRVMEILKLPTDLPVSPAQIRVAGERVCGMSWNDLLEEHPGFMPYRAHQACFAASYIYSIVTQLYALTENDQLSFFPTDTHHAFTVGWPLGSVIATIMKWSFQVLA